MEPTKLDVRIIFQREDYLWPVNGKLLTDEEFEKLTCLMENTRWMIVKYPGKVYTSDEEMQRTYLEKLSDETLDAIINAEKEGIPLPQSARDDIKKLYRAMIDVKAYKFFREKPDGTYCIGDSDKPRLTVDEFRNLQALMPNVGWVGFSYPRPEDITNDAYCPSEDHAEFLKNYESDPSKFLTFNKPNNNGND